MWQLKSEYNICQRVLNAELWKLTDLYVVYHLFIPYFCAGRLQASFYCVLILPSRCSHVSNLPDGFYMHPPSIIQATLEFPFSQGQTELQNQAGQGRISPCGAGIFEDTSLIQICYIFWSSFDI